MTQYGIEFFGELAAIIASNPPPEDNADALANLAALGLTPGASISTFTAEQNATLQQGMEIGDAYINTNAPKTLPSAGPDWISSIGRTGQYGTDYVTRAFQAKTGIGANTDTEAIYWSYTPTTGPVLDGSITQQLHFENSSALPPINTGGFWSVTVRC